MAELDPSHSSQPNTSPPPGGAPAVRDAEVVVSLRQISESPAVDKGKEQALPPEGACSQSMSPDPSFRLSGTMGATESASPILASKDKEAPDESAGKDNSEMAHAPSQYVDIPRTQASPHAGTLGTLSGVLIPTCENMWGVLIFLRFFQVVGQAGVLLTLVIVFMSYLCVSFTALSLSAIATNGPIDKGGAYFLISRALGPQIGGSVGCVYYLGITLLAVLEVLGAVEMLLYMVEELRFPGAVRLSATVCMLTLAGMVFLGIRFVSKMGAVFGVIVVLTIASYYVGLCVAPWGDAPAELTGLSVENLRNNLKPGFDPDVSFSMVVSIFFPCFTGILSGANRATALKEPGKSITRGTIGAINVSLLMYTSFFLLWGAVAPREYLKHGAARPEVVPHGAGRRLMAGGDAGSLGVVADIAWPMAMVTQIGVIIASISQALQCLVVAPRLLQAIASDGTVPFLNFLAPVSAKGQEPHRALLATTILALVASMIGALDLVAPLLSVCFLACYSCLNLSTCVLAVLRAPNWRPTFKYFHWLTALLGSIGCIAMMFIIQWSAACVTLVLLVALYVYIDWKEVKVDWGTGLGGLRLQWAASAMLSLRHEQDYFVNWRPQLLLLHKWKPAGTPGASPYEEIVDLAAQLKKGKGLCVVALILEGNYVDLADEAKDLEDELEQAMEGTGLQGFAHAVVFPTFRQGRSAALQLAGLGVLTPNTVLQEWPTNWRTDAEEAAIFMETISECTKMQKAMIVAYHLRYFPKLQQLKGSIDVWWIMHDGGLLILMAHLLTLHKIWHGCGLRVFVVAGKLDNSEKMKENLQELLANARIAALVDVVDLEDAQDLVAYSHDWTLRVTEAARFHKDYKEATDPKTPTLALPTSSGSRKWLSRDTFTPLQKGDRRQSIQRCESSQLVDESELSEPADSPSKRVRIAAGEEIKQDNRTIPQETDFLQGSSHPVHRPKPRNWTPDTSSRLNAKILSYSKDAQLVVLNLPDPIRGIAPNIYMEYCESLVASLRRVLFVHGCGKEVWSC